MEISELDLSLPRCGAGVGDLAPVTVGGKVIGYACPMHETTIAADAARIIEGHAS
jgi:hypothetical protein